MEIKHVKASEFNNEVLKADKPVLVDFWADWCGPCKMLGPVLEQVAAKVDDVQIVKINVDEESSVAEKYNIMSIPTLLLFKSGECVAKSVGCLLSLLLPVLLYRLSCGRVSAAKNNDSNSFVLVGNRTASVWIVL